MYNFQLINADTDSISVCDPQFKEYTKEERQALLDELNSLFPEKIKWDDDGYYKCIIVIKAKNYVLQPYEGKIKIKGSALKASMKEKALKEFINEIINCILEQKYNYKEIYEKYVKEAYNITDISRWVFKKSITEKVLAGTRTNETKITDALEGEEYQEGDKRYFYFKADETLGLMENWNNDHDRLTLLEKLYKTTRVFTHIKTENGWKPGIIPQDTFLNYSLKRSNNELLALLGLPIPEKIKKTRKSKKQLTQVINADIVELDSNVTAEDLDGILARI